MYFPERFSAAKYQQLVSQSHLQAWPSDTDYRGLTKTGALQPTKGTIIIFHGNAGSAIDRSYYFDALQFLGYRVIVAEYPGYGGRTGAISEQILINDGIATVETALTQFGEPLFLWGESLGGGIVSGIINSKPLPIHGLVLLTPFDTMPRVAQTHYWFLFAALLVKDKFDNVNNLKHFTGKIAVLLCDQDRIVPNKHSLSLFDALTTNKKLWTFHNAGHNDWPKSANEPWWQEVMNFVDKPT